MRVRLEKALLVDLYREAYRWHRVVDAPLPYCRNDVFGEEWQFVRNYFARGHGEYLRSLISQLRHRLPVNQVPPDAAREAIEQLGKGLQRLYWENPFRICLGPWICRWRRTFILRDEIGFAVDVLERLAQIAAGETRPRLDVVIRLRTDLYLVQWVLEFRHPGLAKLVGRIHPWPWEEPARKIAS
jgi:hypothetical protein